MIGARTGRPQVEGMVYVKTRVGSVGHDFGGACRRADGEA